MYTNKKSTVWQQKKTGNGLFSCSGLNRERQRPTKRSLVCSQRTTEGSFRAFWGDFRLLAVCLSWKGSRATRGKKGACYNICVSQFSDRKNIGLFSLSSRSGTTENLSDFFLLLTLCCDYYLLKYLCLYYLMLEATIVHGTLLMASRVPFFCVDPEQKRKKFLSQRI